MQKRRERIWGLDIYRLSIVLLVFLFHSRIHLDCSYAFLNDFVDVGAIAMTAFFILSGFVLYYNYSNSKILKKDNLLLFYIKRVAGIMPLYFFYALLYIIVLEKGVLSENIVLLPIEVFGLQSVFSSLFTFSHNSGTWFISCLLICYFLYPFLSYLCNKILNRKSKYIILFILIFIVCYSPVIIHCFKVSTTYSNPFFRLLEFFIGVLLADLSLSNKDSLFKKFISNSFILVLITIIFICSISIIHHSGIGHLNYAFYSSIALPFFSIILYGLSHEKYNKPFLNNKWLAKVTSYLSSISYSFFLAQTFAWPISKKLLNFTCLNNNINKIILSFILCLLIASLFYMVIEKPFNKIILKNM